MLEEKVLAGLLTDCGYAPGKPLLLALSGGADSLSLLHILKQAGLPVLAAHFNHHLRPSSSREAEQLQKLCEGWGVPFAVGEKDVAAYAQEKGIGIEEAARQCRYPFLFRAAEEKDAQAVLTAHHADDQAETILMHFLRGAGFNGLEGMRPVAFLKQFSSQVALFRPLLGIEKAELLAYCAEHGLAYISDESNSDTRFFRNQLRQQVIPEIEKAAPQFRKTILRNAWAIQKDNDYLQERVCLSEPPLPLGVKLDALSFEREEFLRKDPAEQARLLTALLCRLEPAMRDFGYERLEALAQGIASGKKKADLGQGISLCSDGSRIILKRLNKQTAVYPQLNTENSTELSALPVSVSLGAGFSLFAEALPWARYKEMADEIKSSPVHAFLSLEHTAFPLSIRTTSPGLRWQPLGMAAGRQKMSDTFINKKIPNKAREAYPLVFSAGEVCWVPGLRIGNPFRIKENEPHILHMELRQGE